MAHTRAARKGGKRGEAHRAGAGVDADAVVGTDVVGDHLLGDGGVAAFGAALAAVAEEPARGHELEDARERALGDDGWLCKLQRANSTRR